MDHGAGGSDAAWAPRSSADPAQRPLLAGYRDFVQIARGGDSVVYRAHQDTLDRDVAIKVVELDDAESVARFGRELALTVRLGRQHPHIMTVLATGTTSGGQPCLVMDYFELGSLHDRLAARGPLPVSEVVAAGSVIADALSFAHTQGVLHRDVKPQNVLVLPTSYVLADFGLARAIDAGHSSSLERFSYRHASPQILDGESPTVADDLWSLGSTLFTLLDGRAPFAADDPDEDSALSYLRRARTEPPRTLERDDLPPRLAAIVARCLSRERGDRFPDAGALRDALDAVPTETRGWAPDGAAAPPAEPAVSVEPAVRSDPDAGFAPPPRVVMPEPVAVEPEPEPAAKPDPEPETAVEPVAVVPEPEPTSEPELELDPEPVAAPEPVVAPVPVVVPPTVEPERPAVSALAQLPADARAQRDADATGLRPAQPPPTVPARHAVPAAAGRGRRWPLAVLALVALVAGVGIGIWRGSSGSPTAQGPGTASRPSSPTAPKSSAPTSSAPRTSPRTSPRPTATATFREATQPRITLFRRAVANSVRLVWHDPSRGQYPFVVLEVVQPQPKAVATNLPPGTTSATIPNVAPGYHCYEIGIFVPGTDPQVGPPLCKTV